MLLRIPWWHTRLLRFTILSSYKFLLKNHSFFYNFCKHVFVIYLACVLPLFKWFGLSTISQGIALAELAPTHPIRLGLAAELLGVLL
jgi:hypothetical protein